MKVNFPLTIMTGSSRPFRMFKAESENISIACIVCFRRKETDEVNQCAKCRITHRVLWSGRCAKPVICANNFLIRGNAAVEHLSWKQNMPGVVLAGSIKLRLDNI